MTELRGTDATTMDSTETTVYCPQCGEHHYWGEHTK
jgi:hypothetical protein